MRSLAPAFILSVGVLFVLFMVLTDSNVLEAFGGRTKNIGSVNGEEITYQQFMEAVERQRENQKQQTGNDIEEAQMDQFREQIWDAMVTQTLFQQQIDKYGITVTDEEIKDVILGNDPPAFLKQSFIDSLGRFNRQMYEEALFRPENKQVLVQAEEYVRQTRLNEKLQSILLASINVTEDELMRKYVDQNTRVNVEYALIDLNRFPDSMFTVTDEDLRKYYNDNLEKYKVKAQRKLKYVLFPNVPSAEDSATARRNLENVMTKLNGDTTGFKDNVDIYSSQPYSRDTVNLANLLAPEAELVFGAKLNSVAGPVASQQGYVLYHVVGTVPSSEPTVKAQHILINQFGSDEKNLEEANKIYNELIAGADFDKIAKEKSFDKGSGEKGGHLGWFTKGAMVPEFEKGAFSAKVGEVTKPLKTTYGYHIIKVIARTDRKYVVEKIINPIEQSASSREANYTHAGEFAYVAEKNDFEKEAELMNLKVQETTEFFEDVVAVPGIGVNKLLVKFAFENGVNTVSESYRLPSGYVVVKISEALGERVRPLDEVKDMIKPLVLREKKYGKAKEVAESVKGQINGDLTKAPGVNPNAVYNSTGDFSVNASAPNIGRDYAFIETALKLDLNKLSDPVKGMRGYYLMKVLNKTQFDSTGYNAQRSTLRDNLLMEKRNSILGIWIDKLKKEADIVDNRHLFFGQ
ncbi:MAG: peptidylprolyl isomerase [Ignavibacteriales bacterium]|nr:MAG: peptidylprolyl isomerase [Ignavibacteriales bacterium]